MMNEDTDPKTDLPYIDPDNPPLTGAEKFVPAEPHLKAKMAAYKAKHAARQSQTNVGPDKPATGT